VEAEGITCIRMGLSGPRSRKKLRAGSLTLQS
jgi:hypothetical protein